MIILARDSALWYFLYRLFLAEGECQGRSEEEVRSVVVRSTHGT
jgi:hypothetical protein